MESTLFCLLSLYSIPKYKSLPSHIKLLLYFKEHLFFLNIYPTHFILCLIFRYLNKIVLKMVINYLFSNKFLYPVLKKIRKKIQTITYLQSHSFEDNIQLKTMLNLLFSLFL